MAYSLENASNKVQRDCPVITVMGNQGMGKTTLAALFDTPFFIWCEDGAKAIPKESKAQWLENEAGNGPLICESSKQVIEQIQMLGREKHEFKTLVIDTITQLNTIIEQEVINSDPKAKGINQALGGYGNGLAAVASTHKVIRDLCERLKVRKNMSIVFVAHTDMETINLPDQEPFASYTIRVNKRSVSHYSDNVDMVAHIKHQIYMMGEEDQKRAVTGGRIIAVQAHPASISKNRYNIKEDLEFEEGQNPLLQYFKEAK